MAIPKSSILKFVELALTIACLGMHYKDANPMADYTELILVAATFGGYLVILIGILAGLIAKEPVGKKIDIFFSLAGCALFIASGSVIIKHYENTSTVFGDKKVRDLGLAKGSLAIINGAVFLLDVVFTYRNE